MWGMIAPCIAAALLDTQMNANNRITQQSYYQQVEAFNAIKQQQSIEITLNPIKQPEPNTLLDGLMILLQKDKESDGQL